tara:strand:- start:883 stop:1050 length:168 start_codon:yes stop_codon:yes gene_type:complete
MNPRKFDAIVPDAMSELARMIEKGERKTRKARTGDRGTIRVKRKRARQLELTLNK